MNEQIHHFASNYFYAIPLCLVLAFAWFSWEKRQAKTPSAKGVFDSVFMARNLAFVGILAFVLILFNKPLPGLEESVIVGPADF